MDSRHVIAYGLILAIVLGVLVVVWRVRRASRIERQEARRPIRIAKKK